MDDGLLSAAAAAALLGVKLRSVGDARRRGALAYAECVEAGGQKIYRYRRADVEAYRASKRTWKKEILLRMYGVIALRLWNGSARWPSRPHPWVARLTGLDAHWGFKREFIKCVYDYSYASKGTGKNIYAYYALAPGIYEVFQILSWKHERRYYICVNENGDIREIDRAEVEHCLKNVD